MTAPIAVPSFARPDYLRRVLVSPAARANVGIREREDGRVATDRLDAALTAR